MASNLPQSEPIMRIGIILPIDKQKIVTISFSDPSLYEIETLDRQNPSCKTPDMLNVSVDDGEMLITKIIEDDNQGMTVHTVPAGRGFHWEKTIDVTLPGII
jgi:hypothetical protein